MVGRGWCSAAIFAAACGSEPPPRLLVVDERVELCAAAPYDVPLDQVQATQWRFDVEAGEYALPGAQTLPDGSLVLGARGYPLALFDVRDVHGASKIEQDGEIAVLADRAVSGLGDDDLDLVYAWASGAPPVPDSAPLLTSLVLEARSGDDFSFDGPRDIWVACVDGHGRDTCPTRRFDVCDPGGPTVRHRISLDRGEIVLDVRRIEGAPSNGAPHRVMFVASEVHIDAVDVVQHDFFRLLHSADAAAFGDGSYAVLAPELEAAGLGCGIAVTDIGADTPRAFTVDCALREIEDLSILAIDRER
jgi:hypothetical protein